MKRKIFLCLALVLGGICLVCLRLMVNFNISLVRHPGILNPTNSETYDQRIAMDGRNKDLEKLIGDATAAIRLDPNDVFAYVRRAGALALQARYDAALADINEAIRLKPDAAEYDMRAGIDVFRGDFQGEVDDSSEAIKLDPKEAVYYARRGAGYGQLGKYDEAIQDCDQAIQLDPNFSDAYAKRAFAFSKKGQMDKAMDDLNQALKLDPRNAETHRNRAVLYLKKDDVDAAIQDLSAAIQLDPKVAESYGDRGTLYISKHNFDATISDYTVLLAFDSTNSEAYANRMGAYWLKGDYQKGIADCSMLVQLNPGNGHCWNDLALMLATCPDASVRDGKKAVQAATQACELSKWQMPPYLATLAAAYAESGDFQSAIKYQEQSLAMPGWPEASRTDMQKRVELYSHGQAYHDPSSVVAK